ncbi:hypothetical protein [Shimia aestuarii]|uniref:Uncharacterized protein n=1 Tax=Shimia aestuarii TaxID=254406 RepID=A0A1I4TEM1_9RHOB|nr:hypothetical protein [Shimia aestuarii]SFM75164.1 hypothetical protein SAMN04488042_1164 [Shimia aestuarii]
MKQHWTLGEVETQPDDMPPFLERQDVRAARPVRQRLMRDLEARLSTGVADRRKAQELSRVEKVMRRNAPDLAGADEAEIAAAVARRRAHLDAKWPRPRLLALILLMVLGLSSPGVVLRLAVWALILFLVASVACGPERARDGVFLLGRRFRKLWKHEIVVARKVMAYVRAMLPAANDGGDAADPRAERRISAAQMPR